MPQPFWNTQATGFSLSLLSVMDFGSCLGLVIPKLSSPRPGESTGSLTEQRNSKHLGSSRLCSHLAFMSSSLEFGMFSLPSTIHVVGLMSMRLPSASQGQHPCEHLEISSVEDGLDDVLYKGALYNNANSQCQAFIQLSTLKPCLCYRR
ncbi:hypothetical protein BKA70DRAFT_1279417 [Coprinopsis sp. MPI-PUGE-AT-0042]|nr:hypothetical protein BKA70DRAFT_1279417 [Coprinopsis sp. MPI-PUGE-AT-0042]